MAWQEVAADKKNRIANSIPPEWRITSLPSDSNVMGYPKTSGILSDEELHITESSATDLVAKLAAGNLTSVAVTTAFLKRAALAHQLVNCALEFFSDIALARARELDSHYEKTGKTVGPLHGLPISLKDQCHIKVSIVADALEPKADNSIQGLETSMGYVSWLGKYATEDSVIVTLLYKAGAILYVKTSVPQSLMICETINNVIGRTLNPWNKNLSPGGSSGGEGAMIGFRGGVIGVGTDLGMPQENRIGTILSSHRWQYSSSGGLQFSIRPPSLAWKITVCKNGKVSFEQSPRNPLTAPSSMEGQETVPSVCGPLAHSVKG